MHQALSFFACILCYLFLNSSFPQCGLSMTSSTQHKITLLVSTIFLIPKHLLGRLLTLQHQAELCLTVDIHPSQTFLGTSQSFTYSPPLSFNLQAGFFLHVHERQLSCLYRPTSRRLSFLYTFLSDCLSERAGYYCLCSVGSTVSSLKNISYKRVLLGFGVLPPALFYLYFVHLCFLCEYLSQCQVVYI